MTDIAWIELGEVLRRVLANEPAGGRWEVFLAKAVTESVNRGDVLAYVVQPAGAGSFEEISEVILAACELRLYTRPVDNVDSGIEALAALTIKGAVQGDLDVTFAGVDGMFSLLPSLAKMPAPPLRLDLEVEGRTLTVHRLPSRMLAKWVRQMTVVSEVALAPSLPFRLVTEVISQRFALVLIQLAQDGDWEAFERLLAALRAWYESAFFHVDWVNGMHHLANDLADVALKLHHQGAARYLDDVLEFLRHNRDRLAEDAQAREVLDNTFKRIEQAIGESP